LKDGIFIDFCLEILKHVGVNDAACHLDKEDELEV
jgi:hypothetical protein